MIEDRLFQEFDRIASTQPLDIGAALEVARVRGPIVRRRRRVLGAAAVIVAGTVTGAVLVTALRSEHGEVGPAGQQQLLIKSAETLNAYPAAQVTGVVKVVDNCVLVGGRVALFPPGTTLADDVISLPSGSQTSLGSQADWSGGYFAVAATHDMAGSDQVYRAVLDCASVTDAKEVALVTP